MMGVRFPRPALIRRRLTAGCAALTRAIQVRTLAPEPFRDRLTVGCAALDRVMNVRVVLPEPFQRGVTAAHSPVKRESEGSSPSAGAVSKSSRSQKTASLVRIGSPTIEVAVMRVAQLAHVLRPRDDFLLFHTDRSRPAGNDNQS